MWNLIAPAVTPIIDRLVGLIPNPNERARAREEMERELQNAINAQALGQMEINKTEAQHRTVFVAGWRPFIGWVCGSALAWSFIGQPMATWYLAAFHPEQLASVPVLETRYLFELVLALLGLGGMRTYEKYKGVTQ